MGTSKMISFWLQKLKENLINSAPLQLEQLSVPSLHLKLKWKIILFKKYQNKVFFGTYLGWISVLTAKESFKILKSAKKVNSKGSGTS